MQGCFIHLPLQGSGNPTPTMQKEGCDSSRRGRVPRPETTGKRTHRPMLNQIGNLYFYIIAVNNCKKL